MFLKTGRLQGDLDHCDIMIGSTLMILSEIQFESFEFYTNDRSTMFHETK